MPLTYFKNQYPKVSHSFFRHEILALKRMGEAGYQRVLQRHSIDTEVTKLAALFGKSYIGGVAVS